MILFKKRFQSIKKIKKNLIRSKYTKLAIATCASVQLPVSVNNPSSFTKNTYLGKNTNFNGMKIRGSGKVTIGDNFHSGSECVIITQNHNYKGDALPYDSTYIVKDVKIGDNVWVGFRVIILGGVTIGNGAIIQAGSVVVKDIPDYGIAGGNPATVFMYRDVDSYKKLLKEKKFI